MNTHILLYQLRDRLRLIDERIMEREEVEGSTANSPAAGDDLRCVLASGALMELRSERLFLAGLIADIEGEGVAPEDDSRYSVTADLPERHEQEGRPATL